MRVVFMGTPEFAVPSLRAVHAAGHEVLLAVAQPDRPAGRGNVVSSPPVVEAARSLGVPTAQPTKVKTGDFPDMLEALAPDVIAVVAYGRILTKRILDTPKYGCVNVHGSLLPRWRGAAPIQWAIWQGDAESGVCTQRMAEGLDTGPIYLEERVAIDPRETGGSLHDRLAPLAADVLVRTLAGLPGSEPRPQDESQATHCGKLEKEMGLVLWNRPVAEVDRQIRAMTPWPGGFAVRKEGPMKILEARPIDDPNMPWTKQRFNALPRWDARTPGTVLATNPLVVKCGDGGLELVRVQAAGRRAMTGAEFANGARLLTGVEL